MQVGNPKLTHIGQSFAPKFSKTRLPSCTDSSEGWVLLCMLQATNTPLPPTGCRAKAYQSQTGSSKLGWSITEVIKRSDVLEFPSILQLFFCSINPLLGSPSRMHFSGESWKTGKFKGSDILPKSCLRWKGFCCLGPSTCIGYLNKLQHLSQRPLPGSKTPLKK